jgi:chromosome segregation protein
MTLGPGECLVTPEGIQIGRNWLGVPANDAGGGVLARAEAIRTLQAGIAEHLARETELLDEDERLREARDAGRTGATRCRSGARRAGARGIRTA